MANTVVGQTCGCRHLVGRSLVTIIVELLPSVAVWKGDRVAACIAAASVVAKVTRDRIMVAMHEKFPHFGFDEHKGYVTPEHQAALKAHGPCSEHRFSYVNVRGAVIRGSVDEDDEYLETG